MLEVDTLITVENKLTLDHFNLEQENHGENIKQIY